MDATQNQVTDTSGIAEGDGHWLHDHPDVMANPGAKNALAKYTGLNEALFGGVEAQQTVGKPRIDIPADDADDATKLKFQQKINEHRGVPEKVEGYKVTRPEGADETNYNFAAEKAFLELAKANGYTQEQMAAAYEFNSKMVDAARATADEAAKGTDAKSQEKVDADNKAAVTLCTEKWGGETQFKENMELIGRLGNAFGGEELEAAIDGAVLADGTKLGNSFLFNDFFLGLANMAIAEGRTMESAARTKAAKGALSYSKMEARKKAEG